MTPTTLKQMIKSLFGQLFAKANVATPQGQRIYQYARGLVGRDASPRNLAPQELACAESVSQILSDLFPPFQVITGTYALNLALKGASEFAQVATPLPGDIIISPTGLGGLNGVLNGHTGIVGEGGLVMSNNSSTGLWDTHLNLASWNQRYRVTGGYPVNYFRRII